MTGRQPSRIAALARCNERTDAMSIQGLGCAKTQTCCGAVEWLFYRWAR